MENDERRWHEMENSIIKIEDLIQQVDDQAKKAYMQRIWAMEKEQIFHELMRVHGESAKLLNLANAELNRLHQMIDENEYDEPRH